MTCVLSPSSWHAFGPSYPTWSSMNPAEGIRSPPGHENLQQGVRSAEVEARLGPSPSGGIRRPSRAGTRTVQVLTEKQLERKRANDRHAQRAIRQRTKDHIGRLERSLRELQEAHEATKWLMANIQQRNQKLEEENAYFHTKLAESGFDMGAGRGQGHRPPEAQPLTVPTTSSGTLPIEASVQPPNSVSSSHTALSMTASQSSSSRQGSFQAAPMTFSDPNPVHVGHPPANWRPAYSSQEVQTIASVVQDIPQGQVHAQYGGTNLGTERPPWAAPTPSQPHAQQHYAHSPAQTFRSPTNQQPAYNVPPSAHLPNSYSVNPPAQTNAYTAAQPPPSAPYSGTQQPAFTQPTHYALPPVYAPTAPPQPPHTMAPPPVPQTQYHHPPPGGPHYGPPPGSHGYATSQYPNG